MISTGNVVGGLYASETVDLPLTFESKDQGLYRWDDQRATSSSLRQSPVQATLISRLVLGPKGRNMS